MLFFKHIGKEEGEARGSHCDVSFNFGFSFFCFVLSLIACSFSFCSLFKGATLIWMEFRIALPVCVCISLFNVHLLLDCLCADGETFKGCLLYTSDAADD